MGKAAPEEVWLMAKVAVARTEECSGQTWDDEDRGEEVTILLEKAGYDPLATSDRVHAGEEAVKALLDVLSGDANSDEILKADKLGRMYLEQING